jgi:HSP20 family protein
MSVKIKKSKATPERTAEKVPARHVSQHPLLALRQEVDNLFDTFFSGFSLGPFGRHGLDLDPLRKMEGAFESLSAMVPRADFSETDELFRVTAELPGMDEDNIEVTLSDDVLVIKGEKKEDKTKEAENYHLTERHYGSFRRSFRVPEMVDQENVGAAFAKGVLEITLPKKPATGTSPKKIKIKGG